MGRSAFSPRRPSASGKLPAASFVRNILTILILVATVGSVLPRDVVAAPIASPSRMNPAQGTVASNSEPRYGDVQAAYQKAGDRPAGARVVIAGSDYSGKGPAGNLQVVDAFQGVSGKSLLWPEEVPWVEWTVDVPASGLYGVDLEYYPLPGKQASIQRGFQIDGKYPFVEARHLVFYRTWKPVGKIKQDADGNDIHREEVEAPRWQSVGLSDGEGWYAQPFTFYLSQGPHRFRLITIREPIAIHSLSLVPPTTVPAYADVRANQRRQGLGGPRGNPVIAFQAEDPSLKADPTIRSEVGFDPLDQPAPNGHQRLNEFGGWRWREGGRWVEWTFDAPASGFYQLGFREWQGFDNSLPVFRKIEIDGKVPFREFLEVAFPYHHQWQLFRPAQPNGKPYLVYLTAGQHTLRMTPELGPLRYTLWTIDDTTQEMSRLARQVTLITGPNPDPYRVWNLAQQMPDLVPRLTQMADDLSQESRRLEQIAGYRPNAANTLLMISDQLRSIASNPDSMPGRLGDFLGSETTLGYWLLNLRNQPVVLDYIWVGAPSATPPRAEATILESAWAAFQNFLGSFSRNYTDVGPSYQQGSGGGPVLTVWVGRGREWGEIMKEMIDDDFTPKTGIRVNLQVFPPGQLGAGGLNVLLLAASSGQAPDVATGVEPNLPVEFALRGGAVNLTTFPDFPKVAERFRPGAMRPYGYRGGTYALPETQDFTMMFYRTDILHELGLKPPKTWQDVDDMIWLLQQNGMDFYLPPIGQGQGGIASDSVAGFTPFLYQHGGSYYSADGTQSALDSPAALAAFKQWSGLYTNYKIPIQADFFNRMRTGEMPIGIANYWTYVLLSTAAPELTGRWEMAPIPGIRRPDGTIDRSTGGAGTAVVMFRESRNKEAAWKFMKWWMDSPTQVRFGTELESLLGVEARWNTANVAALQQLPWPRHDIDAIMEQWKWFREPKIVPGGYFTNRHVVNAWNRVVLQGDNVRDAMDLAVRDINRELRRKREEFAHSAPVK